MRSIASKDQQSAYMYTCLPLLEMIRFQALKIYDLPHFPSKTDMKRCCNKFGLYFGKSYVLSVLISRSVFALSFCFSPDGR